MPTRAEAGTTSELVAVVAAGVAAADCGTRGLDHAFCARPAMCSGSLLLAGAAAAAAALGLRSDVGLEVRGVSAILAEGARQNPDRESNGLTSLPARYKKTSSTRITACGFFDYVPEHQISLEKHRCTQHSVRS